jgi:hypothetical protein
MFQLDPALDTLACLYAYIEGTEQHRTELGFLMLAENQGSVRNRPDEPAELSLPFANSISCKIVARRAQ